MSKVYSKSTYENSIKSSRNQIMKSSYYVNGYCEIPNGVLHFQGDIPGVSLAQARYYIVYMIRDVYGSSVWINPVFFIIGKPKIKPRFENREMYFNLQEYSDNQNRIFVEFNDHERQNQSDTKNNYGDLMPKVHKVDILPRLKEIEYNDEKSFLPTHINCFDVNEINQSKAKKSNKDYLGGFTIFTKSNIDIDVLNKKFPIVTNSYIFKAQSHTAYFENKMLEDTLPLIKLNVDNYKSHLSKTHLNTLKTYILDLQQYCNDYEKGFIDLEISYEFNNVEYIFKDIGSIPINISSIEDISYKNLYANIKLLKAQLKDLYDTHSYREDYELDIKILKPVFDSVLGILAQLDDFYVVSFKKNNPSKSLGIILNMYETLADISFIWDLIGAGSYDCYVVSKFMEILKHKIHLVIMYLLVDLDKVINDYK